MAVPGVGGDEVFDKFFDDGMGGIVGGELGEVLGGFEGDHGVFLRVVGTKKPAEPGGSAGEVKGVWGCLLRG